jgi:peptide deformylase
MVLPIYAYGQPVLKKRAEEVDPSDEGLNEFISNMWDTMYHAGGVGLAAPQVGRSLRIFLVDTAQIEDDEKEGIKEVFINPEILEFSEDEGNYEEGCLSIPDVTGDVIRPNKVKVRYLNGDLEERELWLEEMEARVFQHEFDHVEGVLFVEKLKPLRKKRIQKKLEKIKKGQISAKYKLKFI